MPSTKANSGNDVYVHWVRLVAAENLPSLTSKIREFAQALRLNLMRFEVPVKFGDRPAPGQTVRPGQNPCDAGVIDFWAGIALVIAATSATRRFCFCSSRLNSRPRRERVRT